MDQQWLTIIEISVALVPVSCNYYFLSIHLRSESMIGFCLISLAKD